ncbi:hypothetical protein HKBW3S44_01823, partial [Candidatus Hakubella thermalkaliphila]
MITYDYLADTLEIFIDLLQAPKLGQEFGRRLGPDTQNAGYIIRAISHQTYQIRSLGWGHPVPLQTFLQIVTR